MQTPIFPRAGFVVLIPPHLQDTLPRGSIYFSNEMRPLADETTITSGTTNAFHGPLAAHVVGGTSRSSRKERPCPGWHLLYIILLASAA